MRAAVDKYFALHARLEAAVTTANYPEAARCASASIPLFQALVDETTHDYGRFDIKHSVAVESGGRVLAALGDHATLEQMLRVLQCIPDLSAWSATAAGLLEDSQLGERILNIVADSPGIIQIDLKSRLDINDGRRIATICLWLNKVGRLQRHKHTGSYALFPCGTRLPR